MTTTLRLTAADLESMGEEGELLELLDGEVLEAKFVGMKHGAIGQDIAIIAGGYARSHRLGQFFTSDTQFIVASDPRTVFRPDVGFVKSERLAGIEMPEGICPFSPDLVVEVLSPSNNERQTMRKIARYQSAGTSLVWLVNTTERTITVFAQGQPERILTDADTLDGGEVLPGFTLPLAELFQ